jgi:ribonuclease R
MSKGIYRYNAEPKNDKKNLLNRYIHHKYANKYNSLLDSDSDSDLDLDIISRKNKIKIINENNDDKLLIYLGKIALNKSKYSANREENIHYGIGIMGYSHWTSPIRRLPDLLNQCLLLGYDISKETIDKYLEHVNYIELKQDDIEYFCNCWNNNSSYDIGDILTGIIIKTSQTGIITYIESLNRRYSIHISKLSKNRLEWNPETMELKSSNLYNDSYKLFDNIELIIIKKCFDIIEFDLVKK